MTKGNGTLGMRKHRISGKHKINRRLLQSIGRELNRFNTGEQESTETYENIKDLFKRGKRSR